jgi:hypothetical protein
MNSAPTVTSVHRTDRPGRPRRRRRPRRIQDRRLLRQGWNGLLLKVIQDTGPWEFCLRLRTSTGERLEGLRVQAMPPEQ